MYKTYHIFLTPPFFCGMKIWSNLNRNIKRSYCEIGDE